MFKFWNKTLAIVSTNASVMYNLFLGDCRRVTRLLMAT